MKLLRGGKKPYSNGEQALFAVLPQNGTRITSEELARRRMESDKWHVENPRAIVVSTMGSLSKKVAINREPFRIVKSKRRGPYPVEFWLEPKGNDK